MGLQRLDIDDFDVEKALTLDSSGANSSNDESGDWIDLQSRLAAKFLAIAPVVTNGHVDITIHHADEDDQSDSEEVPDKYLTRTESDITLDAADEVATIGYTGPRRYVRFTANEDTFDGIIAVITEVLDDSGRPADTTP